MVVPGRDLVVVRGVRGQRRVPALRGPDLRGLQGILQADRPEERQVRLPRRQELSGGQAAAQPVPVLPLPKVPGGGDGEGGGADGRAEGAARAAADQAAQPARPGVDAARGPHHGPGEGPRRLYAQAGESGLFAGWQICTYVFNL